MFHLQHTPGRTAIMDGKEYLFFSGYSYLGMQYVAEFIELVKEGIDKYGWLFPSSRISNTQLQLFEEFEEKLAEIAGTEAAVCFSSGFLAGRAVMHVLKDEAHSCAPNTHPAICIEKSSRQSFKVWKDNIGDASIICFDSINPLTAEVNDVSFLQGITRKVTCVIDDSHGAGLLNNGRGVSGSFKSNQYADHIISLSLSKSYGIAGGAACCEKKIADKLRSTSQYTASTSLSPAFAYAFLNAQHLYEQQRRKLIQNITIFDQLTQNRFSPGSHVPIFILPAHLNTEAIENNGILISSFAYPDPAGEKINRVVVNALHTEEDLYRLAEVLI